MAVELLGAGNDRIDFGDLAGLAGATGLTIAFTLKPDNNTDVKRLLTQWGNTAATEQCFLISTVVARRPGIVVYNGGNYFGRQCDNNVLTAGAQSRVLMTWATGTPNVIHIWVDGVDQPISAWVGSADVASLLNSVRSVQLGHETDEAVDGVDGDYAELAIWTSVVPDWFAEAYTTHGLSPRFCRNGGLLYAPLWNAAQLTDEWGGVAGAHVGAADATHPTVLYPALSPLQLPPSAYVPALVFGDHPSADLLRPDSGAGPPTHAAPIGTFYWDSTNKVAYQNNNGATGWTATSIAGAGTIDLSAYTITNDGVDRTYDADATSIDELADVLATLIDDLDGGVAVVGAAEAVTYTPAVLADWDGDADPGNVDDALDELAERTTDIEERGVFEANSSTDFLWGAAGVWLDQTPFIGTINGAPTATTIVYNHTSGELSISPGQVIHNTTLGERACITAIDVGTNTITVEADSPDDVSGWANTNALTTASQTNTGRGGIFVDIDANRVLGGASVVALNLAMAAARRNADAHAIITHPYAAYVFEKENQIASFQDDFAQYKQWVQPIGVADGRHYFTMCFLNLAADNNTSRCSFQGQFTKLVT